MTAMTGRQSPAPLRTARPWQPAAAIDTQPGSGQAPPQTVPHPGQKRELRCKSGAVPATVSRELMANLSTGASCPGKAAESAER